METADGNRVAESSESARKGDERSRLTVFMLLPGLGSGGAEISLAELLPGLIQEDIKPVIICMHRRDDDRERGVREIGGDVRHLPDGWRARIASLRRMLRMERVDVLHTSLFEADVVGRLAAVGTGVPVLGSLVNTTYEPIRLGDPNVSRLGLFGNRMIDQWTARLLSHHFHAVTRTVKASAVRRMGLRANLVSVVERGRGMSRLGSVTVERRSSVRKELGLKEGQSVVLTVGRQEYQKGHVHLIAAMEEVVESEPDAVLLIAGRKGNIADQIERALESSPVRYAIRRLGQRNDVPDLLAACDIFAFPSLYEGTGGAMLEAMALGVPIVASDLETLRDVVRDGESALLVPAGSPDALAAAIIRLLDNPELATSLGMRAKEVFASCFNLDRSVRRMAALYRHVAARTAGPLEDSDPFSPRDVRPARGVVTSRQ